MRATRLALSLKNGFVRQETTLQLLLPMSSVYQRLGSACQGVWSVVVNPDARDSFETLTNDRVINHEVVAQATHGSVLIFALFHNLHSNHLWNQYKFDAKEFLQTVGPAMENFFDTTETLRNQLRSSPDEKKDLEEVQTRSTEQVKEKVTETIAHDPEDLAEALLGKNRWRTEAEENPESSAADLWKMATPQCFDSLYYVTKFGLLGMILDPERKVYKEGSCEVGGIALLDARALVLDKKDTEATTEYPEFEASDEPDPNAQVAAQLDVLCEISYTFSPANDKDKEETYTDLAVAVIEGWLNGGPDNKLSWKVAQVRGAHEFEFTPSISR